MTAVTPERGEDADTVLDWLQMAEAQPVVGMGGVLRYPPICQTELDAIRRLAAPSPATDEVVEVLRPFAEAADSYDDEREEWPLFEVHDILVGHLRAARDLLAKLEVRG